MIKPFGQLAELAKEELSQLYGLIEVSYFNRYAEGEKIFFFTLLYANLHCLARPTKFNVLINVMGLFGCLYYHVSRLVQFARAWLTT